MALTVPPNSFKGITAIGVSIAILLILSTALITTVVLLIWSYKRRSAKQNTDSSYSTLSRGTGPWQQIQPQSIQHNSAELYDQIHLSPSTGQTEFIPKNEIENVNNPTHHHPTHSTSEHSVPLNAAPQNDSQLAPQNADWSSSEQPTYATVDKTKKKQLQIQTKKGDAKHNTAEKKGPPVSPYSREACSSADREAYATGKEDPIMITQKSIENMYASIDKDQKKENEVWEINPPATAEELYTAVNKKPKDEEKTPPIPPYTVEELYTAVEKKPKGKADEDDEVAPPIPPHTKEELYTAVKKPKKSNKIVEYNTTSSDGINSKSQATQITPEHQNALEQVAHQSILSHVLGKLEDSMDGEKSASSIPPHHQRGAYSGH